MPAISTNCERGRSRSRRFRCQATLATSMMFWACVPQVSQFPPIPPSYSRVTQGDIGRDFDSTDEAAIAACEYIARNYPNRKKWEYAGCFYRGTNQKIKVGLPETIESAQFCMVPDPPEGMIYLGDYHGHTSKEEFSGIDTNTRLKTPKYLCTPSGGVFRRTPDGNITRLK